MDPVLPLTQRLRLYSAGFREHGDSIFAEILPRLRQIAAWKLSRRRSGYEVTPNDLVNETWLTRLHNRKLKIDDREHFFGIAGRAMQQALVDLARKEIAARRGGNAAHISFHELLPSHQPIAADAEQVVAIGMLLDKLATDDPLTALIVRERHFSGFELHEIATGSGLTLKQVRYRWTKGKKWLASRLVSRQRVNPPRQGRE